MCVCVFVFRILDTRTGLLVPSHVEVMDCEQVEAGAKAASVTSWATYIDCFMESGGPFRETTYSGPSDFVQCGNRTIRI